MIRVHAVVPGDWNPSGQPAATANLSVLRGDQLAVLYDETETAQDRDPQEIVAYGRALTELGAAVPLLPVRYGTTVADLDELRQTLEQRADEWQRRLAAVAGHDEMIVHIAEEKPAQSDTGPTSGREYLMAKVRAHTWARDRYDELLQAVRPHVHDVRRLGDRHGGVRIAFLVPQSEHAQFLGALDRSAAGGGGRQMQVTGPWPPFSFAEEGEET